MRYWIVGDLAARTPSFADGCEVLHPVTHTWEQAPELARQIREGEDWRPITAADALFFVAGLPATG